MLGRVGSGREWPVPIIPLDKSGAGRLRRLVTHLSNKHIIRDFAVPKMAEGDEALRSLTEDERRALRGSKFAPLPVAALPAFRSQPRLVALLCPPVR